MKLDEALNLIEEEVTLYIYRDEETATYHLMGFINGLWQSNVCEFSVEKLRVLRKYAEELIEEKFAEEGGGDKTSSDSTRHAQAIQNLNNKFALLTDYHCPMSPECVMASIFGYVDALTELDLMTMNERGEWIFKVRSWYRNRHEKE